VSEIVKQDVIRLMIDRVEHRSFPPGQIKSVEVLKDSWLGVLRSHEALRERVEELEEHDKELREVLAQWENASDEGLELRGI